ncbi:hypothetical protein YP76_14060 [Sphingobium chungbukense]|uniref:TonB-dependent receptor-like beta-barrel domain-containing protein n=1 Tax=Sphingobium chungbukense TaxID=56193 RepID=A0A0M3AMX8_9SPHN|nr:hypothetical protein YP76_14060 [Sphingobium chungbukense]
MNNFEVGLKKDWDIGFPLRTNLAAYTQKFDNVVRQSQNPATPIFAILTNASQARLSGFEAEISAKPFTGFDLSLSYGHVDARYTAPFRPFANSTFNAEDFEFALVPKHTVAVNASYTLPLDEAIGKVSLNANYTHQSRMWWDDTQQQNSPGCSGSNCGPLNHYSQKPYGLLDLRVDWRRIMGSAIDVAFWATNVTKTKYFSSSTNLGNVLGIAKYPGQPRFFGLDVTVHFGAE